MPSRRSVLLGGAGVVAAGLVAAGAGIEQGLLPGRPFFQEHLGLNGEDGVIPDVEPGPELEDSFTSAARGGVEVGWSLILPPGGEDPALPLVVALHWLGVDHRSLTGNELGLDRYLAQHVADGGAPFAIAAPDGGTGYWHLHDGDDAGAMVTDELLPILQQRGYDTTRIGLLGWSMGGYGVLRLAGLRGPDATAAVVASSPALWKDADDASPSGFDDAEEYEESSVFDDQAQLTGIPVRVDIGTGDPFYRDVQDYVAGFSDSADVTSTFEPGGHTPGYWRRMLPAQLDFLGRRVGS
ncbi:MAG TPA: alpha/beta hydrolase-fold protein [Nocardioides sp.]|uniref:alpha/beta hydrolase n=1 Tax=Nocardioides sp. TaxID=35761 RepID=UPI002E307596|nr:alpha/beta hydrolase-fold protein [Nocardioides sp.]HEX5088047.1 alpha/beta hydrolase-fold protein [Nocardioides sp.]